MSWHDLAAELLQAEKKVSPIEPLSERDKSLDLEGAYRIQMQNVKSGESNGRVLTGYKIGLTSREAQSHFNVFEPDFGHLFGDMAVPTDGELNLSQLIQPKIEGEIAFVLEHELKGPGVTSAQAIRAVAGAMVSMEVVDSRIKDWKIKAVDTIADNGSSARFILSNEIIPLDQLDLANAGMALSCNGEVQLTASGAAVMGHPINALVFLANELGSRGIGLQPGQVILSGSLGGMISLRENDYYQCEVLGLGSVRVKTTRSLVGGA